MRPRFGGAGSQGVRRSGYLKSVPSGCVPLAQTPLVSRRTHSPQVRKDS
jgi:hypothetical protein